jgi:hypothetical protein
MGFDERCLYGIVENQNRLIVPFVQQRCIFDNQAALSA